MGSTTSGGVAAVRSSSFLAKILNLKWQILALSLILVAIFRTNGGFLALRGFGRILLPILILYIGLKFLQARVKSKFGGVFQKIYEAQRQAATGYGAPGSPGSPGFSGASGAGAGQGAATLTPCPKCGVYAMPGHSCQK